MVSMELHQFRISCHVSDTLLIGSLGERILKLPNEPVGEGIAPGCTTVHSVAYLRMAKCYKELGQVHD